MVRVPCCDKMGVKKGTWTPAEDQILKAYVETHGPGNWRTLPKQAGLARCGKSCRFRWMNYLRSDIKRGDYTEYEEETIIKLHAKFGNRWSLIAAGLPGRTDNEIKNVWHTRLKKRQQRQFPVRPEAHLMNTKAAETDNKPEWLQPPNTSSKPVDVVLPSSLPHVGELLEPQNTGPCDGEEDIMAFWYEILMKLNEFP